MSLKPSLGLAPLLLVAFALLPATVRADSQPHYFRNGIGNGNRLPEGEREAIVAWGTLSLTNVAEGTGARVTCHNVVGGFVENPGEGAEGPAGIGDTQSFAPYECESAACTPAATGGGPATYISVLAEPNSEDGGNLTDLKWSSQLRTEGSTIRQETSGVHVNVICHVQTGEHEFLNVEEKSEGAQAPSFGAPRLKAVAPPEINFDGGSLCLHGPGKEMGREGKVEGTLKVLGYEEQSVINAKGGTGEDPADCAAAPMPVLVNEKGESLVKNKFTATGGMTVLEAVAEAPLTPEKRVITCTTSGIVKGKTESKDTVEATEFQLTGCNEPRTGQCKSAGAAAGEITTGLLSGLVGYVKKGTKEVGVKLSGTPWFANFTCKGTFEKQFEIKGSVVGVLTPPVGGKGKTFTLTFKQAAGVQMPTTLEGEAVNDLTTFWEPNQFGKTGLSATETITFEEEAELKA